MPQEMRMHSQIHMQIPRTQRPMPEKVIPLCRKSRLMLTANHGCCFLHCTVHPPRQKPMLTRRPAQTQALKPTQTPPSKRPPAESPLPITNPPPNRIPNRSANLLSMQTWPQPSNPPTAENPLPITNPPPNRIPIRSANLLSKQTLPQPSNPPTAENPAAKPTRMPMPTSVPAHSTGPCLNPTST